MRTRPFFCIILCCAVCQTWAYDHKVRAVASERIEVTAVWDETPDEAARAVLAPYKESVDSVMMPELGTSLVEMNVGRPESVLSNWTADLLVELCNEAGLPPADLGLMNMGGLRSQMPKGVIRRGDILLISPFENHVVLVELQGTDLLELMKQIAAKFGEGVSAGTALEITKEGTLKQVTLHGRAIEEGKTYRVATIDYLAEGNDRLVAMKKQKNRYDTGWVLHDAMMQYIRQHKVVTGKVEGRVTIK